MYRSIEHHAPPESLVQAITNQGGLNRLRTPQFRVVWGWDRLAWHGGKFRDYDDSRNFLREVIECRQVPKYIPPNRWYLEVWMPPEYYGSPIEWETNHTEMIDGQFVATLGPYPAQGEYELLMCLQTPEGEFAPLTPTTCEAAIRLVIASRSLSGVLKRAHRKEMEEKERAAKTETIFDQCEEARRPFNEEAFVTVPERKIILTDQEKTP